MTTSTKTSITAVTTMQNTPAIAIYFIVITLTAIFPTTTIIMTNSTTSCLNPETRLDDFYNYGFRTIVFIFIVIFTTFRPICPLAFF